MDERVVAVDPSETGERIDIWAAGKLDISRSTAQRLLSGGFITIGGSPVKPSYKTRPGDIAAIRLPEPEPTDILPEDIPLDVLYEDVDLIVINKPSGMVVHPAPGHYGGTLVNALLYHLGENLSGINGVLRPGIVHRIDMDTSGVIVAAKNDAAHLSLSRQLAEHSVTREYRAIVFGGFKDDEGRIDAPIARHPVDRKRMAIVPGGRRAVTNYRVLERLGAYTLISARLETGRTHQIRVHMASIGHPLLGDTVYGPERQPINTDGQCLHALLLGFIHPSTDEYTEFSAEPPTEFTRILEILRRKAKNNLK